VLAGSYALLRGRRQRSNLWPVLFAGALLLCTLALEASLVLAAIAFGWLIFNRARYRKLAAWFAAAALPVALYFLLRLGIAHVPVTASGSVLHWAATEPLRVINAFGEQLQLLVFPFNQKVIYVPSDPFTGLSGYTVLGLLFLGLPLYAEIGSGVRRPAIRMRRAQAQASGPGSQRRPRPLPPASAGSGMAGWSCSCCRSRTCSSWDRQGGCCTWPLPER
jgi:hypothetical protein